MQGHIKQARPMRERSTASSTTWKSPSSNTFATMEVKHGRRIVATNPPLCKYSTTAASNHNSIHWQCNMPSGHGPWEFLEVEMEAHVYMWCACVSLSRACNSILLKCWPSSLASARDIVVWFATNLRTIAIQYFRPGAILTLPCLYQITKCWSKPRSFAGQTLHGCSKKIWCRPI